jgi:hypothetical protein
MALFFFLTKQNRYDMSDISKYGKQPIFFPKTMTANGVVYRGGVTYNLHETPGTIQRWLKRGCSQGDSKDAEKDPRLEESKEVELVVAEKPKQSRKPRKKQVEKSVEQELEKDDNKEE